MAELPVSEGFSKQISNAGKVLGAQIINWFHANRTIDAIQAAALHKELEGYGAVETGLP